MIQQRAKACQTKLTINKLISLTLFCLSYFCTTLTLRNRKNKYVSRYVCVSKQDNIKETA